MKALKKLLARQEYPGTVARKVDKFETELRRFGLHEQCYKDRYEFERKVADPGEKVDYRKQVFAGRPARIVEIKRCAFSVNPGRDLQLHDAGSRTINPRPGL